MNSSIITFPSSKKSEIVKKIMNYVKDKKILGVGYIDINEDYKKYLELSDLSTSSIDNSIEWLEFFKLVKQDPNKLDRFYITEKGYEFFNNYIRDNNIDTDFIYHLLLDVKMPYKVGCTYNLNDKNYRVFETMFKVFLYLTDKGIKFDSRKFDEVYYFKLTDNNYKNYIEIASLITSVDYYSHQRPVIDYLFSVLELFNVLRKVDSYIYELTDDFKKVLMENIIMNLETKEMNDFDDKTILQKFIEFYDKVIVIEKSKDDATPASLRKEFLKEYPIDIWKTMKLREYSLGLSDDSTFCRKVEHGKYRDYGVRCGNDRSGAGHWGIYYNSEAEAFLDSNKNVLEDPEKYWNSFRTELYNYLTNLDKEKPLFSDSFPLLRKMTKTLPKIAYMYYPNKFLSFVTKDRLQPLFDIFGLNYSKTTPPDELSYILNKYIRENAPNAKEEDNEYISGVLWKFKENIDNINNILLGEKPLFDINKDKMMTGGYNKIYYGTPGCGKSHKVKEEYETEENIVTRVTFHPEYSNSDFVGQIIPKIDKNKQVYYEFSAGPFTEALLKAYENPSKKNVLIIEEINRGNASAIFGDLFQLLDRDDDGNSVFSINNVLIKDYLQKNGYKLEKIFLPSNLWIIATMNTSDQNVFTLDTAFKRRWLMHRIPNTFNSDNELAKMLIPGTYTTWEDFVTNINEAIHDKNQLGINSEDKEIGVYFVGKKDLVEEYSDSVEASQAFAEKVLLYIWEDIAKINPSVWFDPDIKTLEKLLDAYNKRHLSVFNGIVFNEDNRSENNDDV